MKVARALLVAPLAAPLWFWFQAMVTALLDPQMRGATWSGAMQALALVVAFGAPIAYVAALLALWPAMWALRVYASTAAGVACVLLGVTLGAAVAYVIGPSLRGELFSIPLSPVVGAECGAAAAFVFWWLAKRPTVSTDVSE